MHGSITTDTGKPHPMTGHDGPDGEYRYSSTPLTSALDVRRWSALRPGRFTTGKETRYLSYTRLGRPQGRSGRVWKISPPTGIRSLDRPACSESLYRLSYRGRHCPLVLLVKFVVAIGLLTKKHILYIFFFFNQNISRN
jgi:hypothetical protein